MPLMPPSRKQGQGVALAPAFGGVGIAGNQRGRRQGQQEIEEKFGEFVAATKIELAPCDISIEGAL